MKRTLLLTFLLALIAMTGWAQEKKDSIYLTGTVADSFTKAAIPDVFVTLMRPRTSIKATATPGASDAGRRLPATTSP